MKIKHLCILFLSMALADVARAQDQRLACNSFAELAATVIQIRQQEQEATRVLNYADANLKDQYPPHVFTLVKEMIREAFERQPVGTTSLEGEVRSLRGNSAGDVMNCTRSLIPKTIESKRPHVTRGTPTWDPIRISHRGAGISIGRQ